MVREIFIWLMGLVLVVLVTYGYMELRKTSDRREQLKSTEHKIELIKEEIKTLEETVEAARDQVKSLITDDTEMEAAIRRERQLTRPGEQVFRIEEPSDSKTAESQDTTESTVEKTSSDTNPQ